MNGDGEEERTAEYRNLTKDHWFKFLEPAHHPEPIIPESQALFGQSAAKGTRRHPVERQRATSLVRAHKKMTGGLAPTRHFPSVATSLGTTNKAVMMYRR
jgi:hypothetical protein